MRTYTTITETTLRRKPREQTLTILDRGIPAFGLRVAPDGTGRSSFASRASSAPPKSRLARRWT